MFPARTVWSLTHVHQELSLIGLLAQWGNPGSCNFDGGGVGINDFLALLANWGPCP